MTKGICRICGIESDLSFEHVPPRSSFNDNTKYKVVDFEKFIGSENLLNETLTGKIKQGGIGFNSICKKCNSFLGSNYVSAYSRWVQGGTEILKNVEYCIHRYMISDVEPLKILKQVISMFLAINDNRFSESNPELSQFVTNYESKSLPSKYRVFTYLTRAEKFRYIKSMIKGDLNKGLIKCSEIAFEPYGFVLTTDYRGSFDEFYEITDFKNYDFNRHNLELVIYQLPTYLPLPLDYRTKKELDYDIENGTKLSKEIDEESKSR